MKSSEKVKTEHLKQETIPEVHAANEVSVNNSLKELHEKSSDLHQNQIENFTKHIQREESQTNFASNKLNHTLHETSIISQNT